MNPVFQQTVDIFSEVVGRKLWLFHGRPETDGTIIHLNLHFDPAAYTQLEEFLAHILFETDFRLQNTFSNEYATQLAHHATALRLPFDKSELSNLIFWTVRSLDFHRVRLGWAAMYPASAQRMALMPRDHGSELAAFISSIALGTKTSAPSRFEAVKPIVQEALQMVRGKSFVAVLLATKWLLQKIIRSLDPTDKPEELLRRLSALARRAKMGGSGRIPIDEPISKKDSAISRTVLAAPFNKLDALIRLEDETVAIQSRKLGAALEGKDKWRRGIDAKVVFEDHKDIRSIFAKKPQKVSDLRSLFFRIMGRRKNTLDDCGVEIDTRALIERKLGSEDAPIFRSEMKGRGFKALLLLDHSSSMKGAKAEQVEEARSLLVSALDFPFVDLNVWGFQASDVGEVKIIRYPESASLNRIPKMAGGTPIDLAIDIGVEMLLDSKPSLRHLFLFTDGRPDYVDRNREFSKEELAKRTREAVDRARRAGIMVTVCFIGTEEGFDISEEEMGKMFGSPRWWAIIDPQHIRREMVDLVTRTFIRYLESR